MIEHASFSTGLHARIRDVIVVLLFRASERDEHPLFPIQLSENE